MHMVSKKDLSSDELDTLRRSRTPLWCLQPMEKCIETRKHKYTFTTSNLFVTLQLLEETLAVLSLGKLCEDHGYSYEWSSGQKPRLTKEVKTIVCKTDNIVPLVDPGLSTSSGRISSSTSTLQDLSSTSPAQVRSDGLAPGDWCGSPSKNPKQRDEKRDDNRDSDDRLRHLPEWLEEFTDNLEVTEVLAPAHISQDSGSERLTNVAPRKHSMFTHFPNDRECEVCLRTKMTRALCRRRTGEAPPRAEKFGDLITDDHKVHNEDGESRNNHRYVVVVQDLATRWIQSYPCETKTPQKTEKSLRKSVETSEKQKLFIRTIPLEFGKSCEDPSWNHRTSTLRRFETSGVAERVRRVKEFDEKWWAHSMECYCLSATCPRPPVRRENSV